jgi:hypothetical protein
MKDALAFTLVVAVLVIASVSAGEPAFDPLAAARRPARADENLEASVPSMCYTKTDRIANPCWTCHTESTPPNAKQDYGLQEEYSFSDFALTNRWTNLFADRSAAIATISDREILQYVRVDNYAPLRAALRDRADYHGWRPDLDIPLGFDEEGFARDGSGWRAVRYKPFPGTFWPTNGSTDDVMIRLPADFRESRSLYKLNLAILEALIGAPPDAHERTVEPVDESPSGIDLDGDGRVGGTIVRIRLPVPRFAGAAGVRPVARYRYPQGTEFLHSVRYLDPDAPSLTSVRMKELRYMRKDHWLDDWSIHRAYEKELNEKEEGNLPVYSGAGDTGLRNRFGWILQGFIEDARGRLRAQTTEETRFCMGCHSGLGVTVDQTFAFARKAPGAPGWRPQDLRGLHDAPQAGHAKPEVQTYYERARGGDEFRANDELLVRLASGDAARAVRGGDRDLAWLLAPSRDRALLLDKAYLALVREQRFELGRDAMIRPPANVHPEIRNAATGMPAFRDGRTWLDWDR